MALHGFGGVLPWARRAIVDEKRWMTAQEFNEAFAVSQFLPGANVVNLAVIFGGRLHGAAGAAVALAGLLLPPMAIVLVLGALYGRYGDIDALQRVLAGVAAAAAGLIGAIVIKMAQPLLREGARRARDRGARLRRGRRDALAAALCAARARAAVDRARLVGAAMKLDTLGTLAAHFALLSLFAIGGAMAVVPEMHRQAVDVSHWMTDRQFADLFAIGQAAPGPNIIVVTLIGYQAAGIPGALVATFAMCGPTCVITYYVSRTFDRFKHAHWRIVLQAGPGSGLGRAVRRRRRSSLRAPPTGTWWRSRSRLPPRRLPIGRASIRCGCSRSRACSAISASCEPRRWNESLACLRDHPAPAGFCRSATARNAGRRNPPLTVRAFVAFVGLGRGDCARHDPTRR